MKTAMIIEKTADAQMMLNKVLEILRKEGNLKEAYAALERANEIILEQHFNLGNIISEERDKNVMSSIDDSLAKMKIICDFCGVE